MPEEPVGEREPVPEQDVPEQDVPEQDVVVHLRLSNASMGTAAERSDCEALADDLEAAIVAAGAGEYDGSEVGGGECVLFFTGPQADRLFAVLQPLLRRHPLGKAATAQLQYGAGEPVQKRV